jgi:LysM repeat protein
LYKYDHVNGSQIIDDVATVNREYVVVKGDTLFSISKQFDLTVEKLQILNNLDSTDIKIGQVLVLTTAKDY